MTGTIKISGWGRYPTINSRVYEAESDSQIAAYLSSEQPLIIFGNGRSYGDSALSETVLCLRRYNKLLGFDPTTGILACQSGVMLDDIIAVFLPRGWFLRVTPGTKYITVGGAIASDVHGKNHHQQGCFSSTVQSLDLLLPDRQIIRCSPTRHADLFHATCGGMGLTGVILSASLKLLPVAGAMIDETIVRCANLAEVMACFEAFRAATYSVAWIDGLAAGEKLGRSVFMAGEHSSEPSIKPLNVRPLVDVPFTPPGFMLNPYSVSVFNALYYRLHPALPCRRRLDLNAFFYPLDKIDHWNRLYGNRGFMQYQFVIPKSAGPTALTRILQKIADSGKGSFLGVLKLFGPQNKNLLSFPLEGYTLALDFKWSDSLFAFLDQLDEVVAHYGGRLYLAKDARMRAAMFRRGYPAWEQFAALRGRYGLTNCFNSLQSQRLEL